MLYVITSPARQINQVDHCLLLHVLPRFVLLLLDEVNPNDGVGPGGGCVHVGGGDGPGIQQQKIRENFGQKSWFQDGFRFETHLFTVPSSILLLISS